jgi:ADP-ribose pyrophosphatase YjhB (NUDIX family)
VCCLDCLVIRKNTINGKTECLLVERGSEPVKGAWWLPGGRIHKGETFFDAAFRKVKEETGLHGKPLQVLGVYNTFL